MWIESLTVASINRAGVNSMSDFITIRTFSRFVPNTLGGGVSGSSTKGAWSGDWCGMGARRRIHWGARRRRRRSKETINIYGVKTSACFLRCGRIIGKMRIVTVASFLNDNRLRVRFSFRNERVGDGMKRRRWRSNRIYLALTITKIQYNGIHNVLKRSRVTKNIEDGFSFLLVTRKVLTKSFDILRKK